MAVTGQKTEWTVCRIRSRKQGHPLSATLRTHQCGNSSVVTHKALEPDHYQDKTNSNRDKRMKSIQENTMRAQIATQDL